jgi:hypothetical protein
MSKDYKKLIYTANNEANNSQVVEHYVLALQKGFVEAVATHYGAAIDDLFRRVITEAMENIAANDENKAREINKAFETEGPNALITNPDLNTFIAMRPDLEKAFGQVYNAMDVKAEVDKAITGMKEQYPDQYNDQDLKEIKFGLLDRLPEALGEAANTIMYMVVFKGEPGELDSEFKAQVDGLMSTIINAAVTDRPDTPSTFEELMNIPMNPEVKDIQADYKSLILRKAKRKITEEEEAAIARIKNKFRALGLEDDEEDEEDENVSNIEEAIEDDGELEELTVEAITLGLNHKTVIAISVEDAKTQIKFMTPVYKALKESGELSDSKVDMINQLALKYMSERGYSSNDLKAKDTATEIARVFVGQL